MSSHLKLGPRDCCSSCFKFEAILGDESKVRAPQTSLRLTHDDFKRCKAREHAADRFGDCDKSYKYSYFIPIFSESDLSLFRFPSSERP